MSFHARQPIIVVDTIPPNYSNKCDLDPIMEIALAHPNAETPYMGVKISPSINLKFEDIPIGSFKVESEFFIIPEKDMDRIHSQVYNLALTAVCNLNDLFSLNHNIPFVGGGNVFYNTPDPEGVKKSVNISFMRTSSNQN